MAIDTNAFTTKSDLISFSQAQVTRLAENLARAEALVQIYDLTTILRGSAQALGTLEEVGAELHFSDILRAAVVLVHATLEDYLRSTAATLLPFADESTLNTIPLVGVGSSGRAEKFLLGRLAPHRGKTVFDLIRESVDECLSTATYNDTTQISSLLVSLGAKVEKVEHLFPQLDKFVRRRHQIVHRADKAPPRVDALEQVESITPDQVREWITAVKEFMSISFADVVVSIAQGLAPIPASDD